MNNPQNRLKWFEAALNDKMPGTNIDDLSQSLRVDSDIFKNHILQGQEFDSMAGSVIKGILGCSINEFVENGRAICGYVSPNKTAAEPSSENEYLIIAEKIMKQGGENAAALKRIIKLMANE